MEEERCIYNIQIYIPDLETQQIAEFYIEDFDGNHKVAEKIGKMIQKNFVMVKKTFSSKINLKSYRDKVITLKVDICKEKFFTQ